MYRDPSGVDIPVAQSDLGDCELDVYQRRAPGVEWQLVRQLHAPQAALESMGSDCLRFATSIGSKKAEPAIVGPCCRHSVPHGLVEQQSSTRGSL